MDRLMVDPAVDLDHALNGMAFPTQTILINFHRSFIGVFLVTTRRILRLFFQVVRHVNNDPL